MRWGAALAVAGVLGAGAFGDGRAWGVEGCPAVPVPALVSARLHDAVLANNEAVIVALGSSSTLGTRSSDVAHSYPAVLQATLTAGLPNTHIAVLNRGVGGEDVAEELPRLERDVIGVRPALVIWQLGANGAMKHAPLETFQRLLTTGVRRLHQAGIDVVLMDNQRAPLLLSNSEAPQIERVMAEVAKETGAVMFARGTLMDHWRDAGSPYAMFMSDDGVHHNDLGYRCLGSAIAEAILQGLKVHVQASAGTSVMAGH